MLKTWCCLVERPALGLMTLSHAVLTILLIAVTNAPSKVSRERIVPCLLTVCGYSPYRCAGRGRRRQLMGCITSVARKQRGTHPGALLRSQEAEGNAPGGLLGSLVSFCLVLDQLDSSCPPRAFGWRAHTKMTTKPGAVFTFWALRPACVSFCVGVIVVGIVVGAWLMLPVDRVIIELREREQHSKGLPQKLGGNYTAPSSKQNDHPCLAPKGPGR